LLFREVLLVARLSLERKRVEWVLRMLLVKNVILPIFPVGEVLLIGALADDWFSLIIRSFYYSFFRLNPEVFVGIVTCCSQIHFVRVDDFGFFFKIESLTLFKDDGALKLVLKVFLVT
jgi:hypothetical protein